MLAEVSISNMRVDDCAFAMPSRAKPGRTMERGAIVRG